MVIVSITQGTTLSVLELEDKHVCMADSICPVLQVLETNGLTCLVCQPCFPCNYTWSPNGKCALHYTLKTRPCPVAANWKSQEVDADKMYIQTHFPHYINMLNSDNDIFELIYKIYKKNINPSCILQWCHLQTNKCASILANAKKKKKLKKEDIKVVICIYVKPNER